MSGQTAVHGVEYFSESREALHHGGVWIPGPRRPERALLFLYDFMASSRLRHPSPRHNDRTAVTVATEHWAGENGRSGCVG